MGKLTGILRQLTKERERVQRQLSGLEAAITAFAGVYTGAKPARKPRKLSAEARAKIAAAQRKRWAKKKATKKGSPRR